MAITAFGSLARFQKTTKDYFLTGRSVPVGHLLHHVATETSTLSFTGCLPRPTPATWCLQLALGRTAAGEPPTIPALPCELFTSYDCSDASLRR